MSNNTIITPTIVAKEFLRQVTNNLIMGKKVSRTFEDQIVNPMGGVITVKRPISWEVTDGATLVEQDAVDGSFTVNVDKRKHVGMSFTTQDLTLSVDQFSERYIKPAAQQLAQQVDSDLCALYKKVWNWVGTAGQSINSFSDFAKGPKRLDKLAVPESDRFGLLSPDDHWEFLGSQTALYIQQAASSAYRAGELGMVGGVNTGMSQSVSSHTRSATEGTPLTRGTSNTTTWAASKNSNTMTLSTDGWTSGMTIKSGDVFTISGVYEVNPRTKASTGELKQFVVVDDTVAHVTTSSETPLVVSPAIITSGPYQNVDSAPGNDKTITLVGSADTTYAQNMVFHKDAFQLVTVPLMIDPSMGFAARASDSQTGLSIRIARDYNITNDKIVTRADILYGVKALRPEFATRISGT